MWTFWTFYNLSQYLLKTTIKCLNDIFFFLLPHCCSLHKPVDGLSSDCSGGSDGIPTFWPTNSYYDCTFSNIELYYNGSHQSSSVAIYHSATEHNVESLNPSHGGCISARAKCKNSVLRVPIKGTQLVRVILQPYNYVVSHSAMCPLGC